MITNEEIIKQADYYLNNEVTMEQAGMHFGVCKKTFQVRMKKLEKIDLDKYKLVQDKKQKNLSLGMIKGGQNGKPVITNGVSHNHSHKYTEEQINELAKYMLENDASLRDMESHYGISKATLLDNLTKDILDEETYLKIRGLLEEHKPHNKRK